MLLLRSFLALLLITALGAAAREIKIKIPHANITKPSTGHVSVMLTHNGRPPLNDSDVTGNNTFFGMNVFGVKGGQTIVLKGGSSKTVDTQLFGHPNLTLDDIPPGPYRVQAYLMLYENVTRSDGSKVQVRFPCGDGAPNVDASSDLISPIVNVTFSRSLQQTISLVLNTTEDAPENLNGTEVGGCAQGNYADSDVLKHVKIRSIMVSDFWQRDMYVGANVLLPAGYNQSDKQTRYPVIYDQDNWPKRTGPYDSIKGFNNAWITGIIPATKTTPARPTPKFLLVTFRHETPFYDDSYGVNTANIGPWGDALNDELIPHIDKHFNTIAEPYARITGGGSTGGYISFASAIFRPDLFGATFSYYPDPLSFERYQDIHLYTAKNAYTRDDGSKVVSIRNFTKTLATVEQENHWELTFGTRSRSRLQWDVWNAVFGIQGLNGYPLEPWNKVTGEIDRMAVEAWRPMDLTEYLTANWHGKRQLGKHLRGRLHVSVGDNDTYFLNEGVKKFQERVEKLSGTDSWAAVTFIPNKNHGGNYKNTTIWTYLDTVATWVADHAPNGKRPLSREATAKHLRGNHWDQVLKHGGHQAALARQADPSIKLQHPSVRGVVVTPGRWDGGVALEGRWIVDGKPSGKPFAVDQDSTYRKGASHKGVRIAFTVTGTKFGYEAETRTSATVHV